MIDFQSIDGFDWDEGNRGKNMLGHGVPDRECEEIFLGGPLVDPDVEHSETEDRFYAIGRTGRARRLIVFFTVRGSTIRVISARGMTRRERTYFPE